MDNFKEELARRNIDLQQFQKVLHRLLEKQIIYRNESQVETELYDLFLRIQDLLEEYLQVLGISVVHHDQAHYVIIYPPGSEIPGFVDDGLEAALQKKTSNNESILLLTLRLLFEEGLRAGDITDEGVVRVPLETVFTRYRAISKMDMPTNEGDRRQLFSSIKQLRVLEFTDLTSQESLINIRDTILCFTLEGFTKAINEVTGEEELLQEESVT